MTGCSQRGAGLAQVVAPLGAELDADPRAEAARDLGDAVQPGSLAASAHHEQVPVADLEPQSRAARLRPHRERPRGAERDDRHHRVARALAGDAVSVPGDAVVTVAVQAEPGADERLAQLLAVVSVQRRPGLVEHRMGQRLALRVAGQEPRDPHGAVVHVHPLLVPRHGAGQHVEELVGRGDEARPQVDPGAVGQRPALDRGAELGHAQLARAEQRGLDDECHRTESSRTTNICSAPRSRARSRRPRCEQDPEDEDGRGAGDADRDEPQRPRHRVETHRHDPRAQVEPRSPICEIPRSRTSVPPCLPQRAALPAH